jgi:hypothetical protein
MCAASLVHGDVIDIPDIALSVETGIGVTTVQIYATSQDVNNAHS